jgi:pimeloyl-ACP methyl ester carboxylesterase
MEKLFIPTRLGEIAVQRQMVDSPRTPLIFLHGVYFDHHLWKNQVAAISDRTLVLVDMPLHGDSRLSAKTNWNLEDCGGMLLDILDYLKIPQIIAVGHSWGSMSILRAAASAPERFESLLLCNMPFHAAKPKQQLIFRVQHLLLPFRSFYTRQVAGSLFGKRSLQRQPELYGELERPMRILSKGDIRTIDRKVILEASDASRLMERLAVLAVALKGEEDYVPVPQHLQTIVVEGGHVSPLEAPVQVNACLGMLLN